MVGGISQVTMATDFGVAKKKYILYIYKYLTGPGKNPNPWDTAASTFKRCKPFCGAKVAIGRIMVNITKCLNRVVFLISIIFA